MRAVRWTPIFTRTLIQKVRPKRKREHPKSENKKKHHMRFDDDDEKETTTTTPQEGSVLVVQHLLASFGVWDCMFVVDAAIEHSDFY